MLINNVELQPDHFYEPESVAKALGKTVGTLGSYRCRKGTLPFLRMGRRILYRGSDVIDFIRNSLVIPGEPDAERSRIARLTLLSHKVTIC